MAFCGLNSGSTICESHHNVMKKVLCGYTRAAEFIGIHEDLGNSRLQERNSRRLKLQFKSIQCHSGLTMEMRYTEGMIPRLANMAGLEFRHALNKCKVHLMTTLETERNGMPEWQESYKRLGGVVTGHTVATNYLVRASNVNEDGPWDLQRMGEEGKGGEVTDFILKRLQDNSRFLSHPQRTGRVVTAVHENGHFVAIMCTCGTTTFRGIMCRHCACVIIKAMQLLQVPATALLLPHKGTQLLPMNAQKAVGDGDVAHFMQHCPAMTQGPQKALLATERTDHKRKFNQCKQALNFALAAADAAKGTALLEALTTQALDFGRTCNSMASQSVCGQPASHLKSNSSVPHLQSEALPPGGLPVGGAIVMATNPAPPKASGRRAHNPTRITKNTQSHAFAALVQQQGLEIQALKSRLAALPAPALPASTGARVSTKDGASAAQVEATDANNAAPVVVVVPAIDCAGSAHTANNNAVAGGNNPVVVSNDAVASPPMRRSKPPKPAAATFNVVVGRRQNDETNAIETMMCPEFPRLRGQCVLVLDSIPQVNVAFLLQQRFRIDSACVGGKVMVPNSHVPPRPQLGYTCTDTLYESLKCWPLNTRKEKKEKNIDCTSIIIGPGTGTPEAMAKHWLYGWVVVGCGGRGLKNFAEGLADSSSDDLE